MSPDAQIGLPLFNLGRTAALHVRIDTQLVGYGHPTVIRAILR